MREQLRTHPRELDQAHRRRAMRGLRRRERAVRTFMELKPRPIRELAGTAGARFEGRGIEPDDDAVTGAARKVKTVLDEIRSHA